MKASWAGIILAAGKGVRMRSSLPKPMHPVCGAPMLRHVATAMRQAQIDRLVAVVSPSLALSEDVRRAAGDGASIAVQREQRGTADAVKAASAAVAGAAHIVVGAGDMPLVSADTVRRLMTCHTTQHAVVTLLTATGSPTARLGRVVRDERGAPVAVVEEADADEKTLAIQEINTSWYCFDAAWLWDALGRVKPSRSGELYLTDLVAIAAAEGRVTASVSVEEPVEALGVNDRVQLAAAEQAMRQRIAAHWMREGVTLIDPSATYIGADVVIGSDTVLHPGTHLRGATVIGAACEIGPDSVITASQVGDGARVIASHVDGAVIGAGVSVGPFSRLRPGTKVVSGAYIGNFAEIKNSTVGAGTHVGHFSYVGDTDLGRNVNIGAGTVTCNFDGKDKHRTEIGDGAFIGSDTMLIAPIKIGEGARTGAGSVVNRDVPPGEGVAGVPARRLPKKIEQVSEKER